MAGGFPVVIPYVGIFLRDHWAEVTAEPWWVSQSWDLSALVRVQDSLLEKVDLDWVECSLCPPKAWRETHLVEAEAGGVFLVDRLTRRREVIVRPPVGGEKITLLDQAVVKTRGDVDSHVPVEDRELLLKSGRLDYASALVERFGAERFMVAHVSAPLWAAYHYLGFTETLARLIRDPGLIRYLLERLTLSSLERLRAYAEAGIDGVWIEDCLCSANEISLKHFTTFALPYVQSLVAETKRLGLKSIYYFCGDPHDRLEKLVEAGVDAISLEESKKGFQVDLDEVDRAVQGRASLFGNLDALSLLPKGSGEELEKEIRRQVEVGRRTGRLVLSLGSPVTPGTPITRVREYVEISRHVGSGG